MATIVGEVKTLHGRADTYADECSTEALGVPPETVDVHTGSEEAACSAVEEAVGLDLGIGTSELKDGVVALLETPTDGSLEGLNLALVAGQFDDGAGQVERGAYPGI